MGQQKLWVLSQFPGPIGLCHILGGTKHADSCFCLLENQPHTEKTMTISEERNPHFGEACLR